MINLFDVGSCFGFAIVGVVCAGLLVEPAPDEVSKSSLVLFEDQVCRPMYYFTVVYCVAMILVRTLISWDMISYATIIVLACGFFAVGVNYAFNLVKNRKWKKIPTPLVGGVMALCSAIFICIVIFPAFGDFEYDAKIAPPENYPLVAIGITIGE